MRSCLMGNETVRVSEKIEYFCYTALAVPGNAGWICSKEGQNRSLCCKGPWK